ncbi:hypothetical protein F4803DRAFT_529655 [Xylaria telfairii]|nr:hypothetical protein F4803DRAFT_529655 [Xylaria telfairii]
MSLFQIPSSGSLSAPQAPFGLVEPAQFTSRPKPANEKLSCPYRKRNPLRFNIRQWPNCASNGFKDLATLKRHIRTYHRRSPHLWPQCGNGFESGETLNERPQVPTDRLRGPASNDPEDGIDDEVEQLLAERKNDLKISSWGNLWQVLFKDDQYPSSDFIAPQVVEIDEVSDTVERMFGSSHRPNTLGNEDTSTFREELSDALTQTVMGTYDEIRVEQQPLCRSDPPRAVVGLVDPSHFSASPGPGTPENPELRRYSYPTYPGSFMNETSLARHQNQARHGRGHDDPSYRCQCGKYFTRKDNFIRHVRPCTRSRTTSFQCRCGDVSADTGDDCITHLNNCGSVGPGRPKRKKTV